MHSMAGDALKLGKSMHSMAGDALKLGKSMHSMAGDALTLGSNFLWLNQSFALNFLWDPQNKIDALGQGQCIENL